MLFIFYLNIFLFETKKGEKTAFWRISNPRAEFLETSQVAIPFFRARSVLTIHYSKVFLIKIIEEKKQKV